MTEKRHFQFGTLTPDSVTAHNGKGHVLTTRVMEKGLDSECHFVDMTIVPPGSSIGAHTHSNDNEEFYIVISGSGEMLVGQETFSVSAGHVIANPRGGTHGLVNNGNEDIELVVIEIASAP